MKKIQETLLNTEHSHVSRIRNRKLPQADGAGLPKQNAAAAEPSSGCAVPAALTS